MGSYDENIRYFVTTGSRSAAFPLAVNIDSGTALASNAAFDAAGGFWTTDSSPRLLQIICLTATPTAANILILNTAGSTVLTIPIAANAANKIYTFPEGGVKMPKGGFGVTTTASSYMFIFSYTRPS